MYALLLLFSATRVSIEPYADEHSHALSHGVSSGIYQIWLGSLVPYICRVSVTGHDKSGGGGLISLGQMDEFCPHERGYKIHVDHSASVSGAAVIVDGRRVQLSSHGSTVIYESDGPGKGSHPLSLDLSNHSGPVGGLTFYIRPI